MKRAVITGIGIVSSIGNNKAEVCESLKLGKSGIEFEPAFAEQNLRSHVCGTVNLDPSAVIDRKVMRFMGDAAAYSYIAMQEAIDDSGLTEAQISNVRTGLIAGSGGASSKNVVDSVDIARNKSVKRVGPYMLPVLCRALSLPV